MGRYWESSFPQKKPKSKLFPHLNANTESTIEEHLENISQGVYPLQGSPILTILGGKWMSRLEEGSIYSGMRLGTTDIPLFIQLNLICIYLLINKLRNKYIPFKFELKIIGKSMVPSLTPLWNSHTYELLPSLILQSVWADSPRQGSSNGTMHARFGLNLGSF
jgi:hypothetical protein